MSHPLAVPVAATAIRRQWADLPEDVRRDIEQRLGSRVVRADSQGSGFTPCFASRLLMADGRRAFVKAADEATQPLFTASFREEVRKVTALPAGIPTPALRWSYDTDGWVVLCFDDVDGRPPERPWREEELTATLGVVTSMSGLLTPPPEDLELPSWQDEMADFTAYWDRTASTPVGSHTTESAELAHRGLAVGAGDTLVHCDLRDDNVIIGTDGRVWICDWNWPVRGAAWIDLLTLLISARGDGYDADAVLASNPLSAGVDAERIDAVLALLLGYCLGASSEPVPASSPWLRAHQRWYAEVLIDWLTQRRGWR